MAMALPVEELNARSRRTRLALLSGARSLLEEGGFEAMTMAAVAERAEVSRRAVYLHFASRAELAVALFNNVSEAEGLAGSLLPVWAAPDAEAALEEWARHLARFHPRILAVARAIERVRRVDDDAAAHWDVVMRDQQDCCRRLADWLAREDCLPAFWKPATAADMLWALMSFDLLEELLVDRGWSPRAYGDHLAMLFRSTFVRSRAATGGR
jgi:AcrR family transcriptional regulator